MPLAMETSFAGLGGSPPPRLAVQLGSPGSPLAALPPSPPRRDAAALVGREGGRHVRIEALPMTPCLPTPHLTPNGRARATRAGAAAASAAAAGAWMGGSTEARLERQEALLVRQQQQIDVLREEFGVLQGCLAEVGALNPDRFLIRLHRHRFDRVRKAHPLLTISSFAEAIAGRELMLDVVWRAGGPPAVHALRAASRAVNHIVGEVSTVINARFSRGICVCGGFDGSQETNTAERFDPAVGNWELLPPMLERRSVLSSAVLGGRLYACGGFDGVKCLRSAERLDPAADCWEPLPPMSECRWLATATVLGGHMYLCGGYSGERCLASAERFDPARGTWECLPPMATSRGGAAAVAFGGRLVVCGGSCISERLPREQEYFSSAERFDPVVGRWESLPSMISERSHAAVAVVGGHLYVCGGCDSRQRHCSAERLGEAAGAQWELLPNMAEPRASPVAAAVRGKIYLCGGRDGDKFLSSAERFDPVLRRWETLRPMSAQRGAAAVAALDGLLYVCGGNDGAEFRRSVERFDPAQGSWELLPPMRNRRSSASAAVMWSCAGLSAPALCSTDRGLVPEGVLGLSADIDVESEAVELPTPFSMMGTPL